MQRELETASLIGEAFEDLREHNGHFALARPENDALWDFDESNLTYFAWNRPQNLRLGENVLSLIIQMDQIQQEIAADRLDGDHLPPNYISAYISSYPMQ